MNTRTPAKEWQIEDCEPVITIDQRTESNLDLGLYEAPDESLWIAEPCSKYGKDWQVRQASLKDALEWYAEVIENADYYTTHSTDFLLRVAALLPKQDGEAGSKWQ